MRIWTVFCIAVGFFGLALSGTGASDEKRQEWTFRELQPGRRIAYVPMRGTGPGGPIDATFIISREATAGRKPVKKGDSTTPPVIVQLCIHDAKQAAPFRLDDLEGPDAASRRLKAARVTLGGEKKPWIREWAVNGWYTNLSVVMNPFDVARPVNRSAEPLAFAFGLGDVIRDYRDLLALVDHLKTGPTDCKIGITPTNGEAEGRLNFNIPLSGVVEAMRQLMAPLR